MLGVDKILYSHDNETGLSCHKHTSKMLCLIFIFIELTFYQVFIRIRYLYMIAAKNWYNTEYKERESRKSVYLMHVTLSSVFFKTFLNIYITSVIFNTNYKLYTHTYYLSYFWYLTGSNNSNFIFLYTIEMNNTKSYM